MVEVDGRAIRLIGLFALLMVIIPFSTYFICLNFTTEIYSAIAAVIIANMLLFMFVILALNEEDDEPKVKKQ